MAMSATDKFDPNQYYRFTNLAVGGEFSLDVDNPPNSPPNGSLGLAPSGPYSGQVWQILESNNTGHFFLSTSFLGAKLKMDAIINGRGDYAPQLRNYTTDYEQTWGFFAHVDASNKTTWTIMPDFIAGGPNIGLVWSVYNDTRRPFLAPAIPDSQIKFGGQNQRWFVSSQGLTIDDPTYSSTHLPALATEAPIVPAGQPTATTTTAAVITSTPTAAITSSSHDSSDLDHDRITGPLVAAAVVPSTVFVFGVALLFLFLCMRRRKVRRMKENSPYSSCRDSTQRPESTIMSEFFDTFTGDQKHNKHMFAPFSDSLKSSNLSVLWRGKPRNPQDSIASALANPLSAPPPLRVRNRSTDKPHVSVSEFPADSNFMPSPLSPKSPKSPWMVTVIEEEVLGEDRKARSRKRDSLELDIYDSINKKDIGQAV